MRKSARLVFVYLRERKGIQDRDSLQNLWAQASPAAGIVPAGKVAQVEIVPSQTLCLGNPQTRAYYANVSYQSAKAPNQQQQPAGQIVIGDSIMRSQ